MTNHVHLLLTPYKENSAALMIKNIGQRYVQYINRTYQRTGTLWEGRYRSCLTQDEHYVLSCYRYIELNPVRANMVKYPSEYLWSSYEYNAQGKRTELLMPHTEYIKLDKNELERRRAYRGLFKTHVDHIEADNEIRSATNGNYVLGNTRFQEQISKALDRRVTRGKSGRPKTSEL